MKLSCFEKGKALRITGLSTSRSLPTSAASGHFLNADYQVPGDAQAPTPLLEQDRDVATQLGVVPETGSTGDGYRRH